MEPRRAARGAVPAAIAFNVDTEQWPDHSVEQVRIAYKLDSNEFRGRETVQLLVEVLEPA